LPSDTGSIDFQDSGLEVSRREPHGNVPVGLAQLEELTKAIIKKIFAQPESTGRGE